MENKRIERRKGPDIWIKSLTWFGGIGWLFMIVTFAIFHKARPESETSIVGFYVNKKRHKRKDDRYNISLVFLLVFSLLGLSYYFFN